MWGFMRQQLIVEQGGRGGKIKMSKERDGTHDTGSKNRQR